MTETKAAVASRNPDWTRDEVTLVCAVLQENGWAGISATDPRAIELSDLLRKLDVHPAEARTATFRNANGVARKTADLATRHPDYSGRPTKGGRIDREVLGDFLNDPDRMMQVAVAIRDAVTANPGELSEPADVDLDASADEGRVLERLHLKRERDHGIRIKKINSVLGAGNAVECEVCGFDFAVVYGDRGDGFIEVHHRLPLHETGPVKTQLTDLALLCSNCHRMIHRNKPWLTVGELAAMVAAQE